MALEFFSPLSNISPFTYRDGETYLQQLKRLRAWIDEVSALFQAQITQVVNEFDAGMASATADAAAAAASAEIAETMAELMVTAQDDAVAYLVELEANTTGALDRRFSTGISVLAKGAVGDGATPASDAFDAAIEEASEKGLDVIVPGGTFIFDRIVTARSNVTVRGQNGAIIKAATNLPCAFGSGVDALSNFTLDGLTIVGGALEQGIYPRRIRSYDPGFLSAISLTGDGYPLEGTHPLVENITIRNCRLWNLEGLPVFFRGVKGFTRVLGTHISNCMDAGFVHCENVQFNDNVVEKSADNGVSISRRTDSAIVANNIFNDCAYYSIWVSGFVGNGVTAFGPNDFVVTGNILRNSGHGGIALRDAPRYGTVTGNLIDGTTFGPVDEPNNNQGAGISITGYPSNVLGTIPQRMAGQINITGNILRNCVGSGINMRGAEDVRISGNYFVDIGSFLDVNQVAILSNTNQNSGVTASDGSTNLKRIHVTQNVFVDTRTPTAMNYAIVPQVSASSDYVGEGNRAYNLRQPHLEHVVLKNAGYVRGLNTDGVSSRMWGITPQDNLRSILPGPTASSPNPRQWEGMSTDESTLLWKITSSGRAEFTGGVTVNHTASASNAPPGFVINGQIRVWHDTTNDVSYLVVDANGVLKKIALP